MAPTVLYAIHFKCKCIYYSPLLCKLKLHDELTINESHDERLFTVKYYYKPGETDDP